MLSYCCAFMYKNTPVITKTVPKPLNKVIGLPNNSIDNVIRNARFAVFATLKKGQK